jgi:hypothetical protein
MDDNFTPFEFIAFIGLIVLCTFAIIAIVLEITGTTNSLLQ